MITVTAQAHPNIAFIKYWGNCDAKQRIPSNGSISMNLDGLFTRTTVAFDPSLESDQLTLNRQPAPTPSLERTSAFLDTVREMAGIRAWASVVSENNFPMGAGIASSASAFAALSLAASRAAGLDLDELQLSRLARTGSGSACRSVPGGFVEWQPGGGDEESYAISIAPAEHWTLVDCIAIVSQEHKPIGSTEGHALAGSSPLQAGRVADAPRRLDICRRAILERDFDALAEIIELDSNMMHAVMQTSNPRLMYWQPASIAIMQAIPLWRAGGLQACYTVDAGPNVHVICPVASSVQVMEQLKQIPGVQHVLSALPGGPARIIEEG
jgi:diphosphomevalonate decarboxylase